jgi:hypothetical protein
MKRPPGGLLAIAFLVGPACLARNVFVETYPSAMKKIGGVHPVMLNPNEVEQVEPFATRGILEVRMGEFESRDKFTHAAEAQAARWGCDVVVPEDAYRMRVAIPNTMGPTFPWKLVGSGMVARQYLCGTWPSTDGEARESRELARLAAKRLKSEGQEEEIECSTDPQVGTHIRDQSCP